MDADERTARTGSEYRNLVSVLNDPCEGLTRALGTPSTPR